MCEHDLALNNPQGLICHKTQTNQINTKDILVEEQSWCNFTHSWDDGGVHTCLKDISPKVNPIA